MKVKCCKCSKEYSLEDNIFETDKANRPILKCPHCGFKHLLDFIPFAGDLDLRKAKELNLTTVYYVTLGASRIANANRVDQSGVDDGDVTGWVKTADFILATRIYTSKGPIARSHKLRWRDVTDAGSFADVAATGEISYSATTVLVDDAALAEANKLCGAQTGYTWQNGLENEGDNLLPDSGTYSLADEYYSEFQWALDCDAADDGHEYEFQLYEVTNGVVIGTCLASLKMVTLVPSGAVYLQATTGRRTQLADTFSPIKIDPTTGRRGTSTVFSKYLVRTSEGKFRAQS